MGGHTWTQMMTTLSDGGCGDPEATPDLGCGSGKASWRRCEQVVLEGNIRQTRVREAFKIAGRSGASSPKTAR